MSDYIDDCTVYYKDKQGKLRSIASSNNESITHVFSGVVGFLQKEGEVWNEPILALFHGRPSLQSVADDSISDDIRA